MFPPHCSTEAGALSTPWQTQCNEAMPWSGKHGLITRVYLQQFGTVEHAVPFALFVSMVLHATYPSNHFLSATCSRLPTWVLGVTLRKEALKSYWKSPTFLFYNCLSASCS